MSKEDLRFTADTPFTLTAKALSIESLPSFLTTYHPSYSHNKSQTSPSVIRNRPRASTQEFTPLAEVHQHKQKMKELTFLMRSSEHGLLLVCVRDGDPIGTYVWNYRKHRLELLRRQAMLKRSLTQQTPERSGFSGLLN